MKRPITIWSISLKTKPQTQSNNNSTSYYIIHHNTSYGEINIIMLHSKHILVRYRHQNTRIDKIINNKQTRLNHFIFKYKVKLMCKIFC